MTPCENCGQPTDDLVTHSDFFELCEACCAVCSDETTPHPRHGDEPMTPLETLHQALEVAFVASWHVDPADMPEQLTHLIFVIGRQLRPGRFEQLVADLVNGGGE
jgi:hypothetical protein